MEPAKNENKGTQPNPETAIQDKDTNNSDNEERSHFCIPNKEFEDMVLQISQSYSQNNSTWDDEAIEALQTAAEHLMMEFLQTSFRLATDADRNKVTKADIKLAREIFKDWYDYPFLREEAEDEVPVQPGDAGEDAALAE